MGLETIVKEAGKYLALVAAPTAAYFVLDNFVGTGHLVPQMVTHAGTAAAAYYTANSKLLSGKGYEGVIKSVVKSGAQIYGVGNCVYDLFNSTFDAPQKVSFVIDGAAHVLSWPAYIIDIPAKIFGRSPHVVDKVYSAISYNGLFKSLGNSPGLANQVYSLAAGIGFVAAKEKIMAHLKSKIK